MYDHDQLRKGLSDDYEAPALRPDLVKGQGEDSGESIAQAASQAPMTAEEREAFDAMATRNMETLNHLRAQNGLPPVP